jgi:HD-GYP domain-containing protein (c-di-GMP phosphodiesterase class II)
MPASSAVRVADPTRDPAVRLSDVIGALTYALDLTEGQPAGHSLRACCIGMRMAREAALDAKDSADLFHALLLKDAGCSVNAAAVAARFGADDRAVKHDTKRTDLKRIREGARFVWRNSAPGAHWGRRAKHFLRIAGGRGGGTRELIRVRCERGAEIASGIGFAPGTARIIRSLDEHWDGGGQPDGRKGASIPLGSRIALLAQTLEIFLASGVDAALDMALDRRGRWFDPELVDMCAGWRSDAAWWNELVTADPMLLVRDVEPAEGIRILNAARLDRVAVAFADIIDAKSPFTYRHSTGVAHWAVAIAGAMGCPAGTQQTLHWAGLLHDIGKLGVSNRVLDKPGRLTAAEFEQVRRHPLYTWEILQRVPAFRAFARTASLHHERMDGSGYPWSVSARDLDRPARILAVADVYEALTADRPYRPGLPPFTVLTILRRESPPLHDPAVIEALASVIPG